MYDCPLQYASFTYKFTGKERDSESGLDNFKARYDSSSLGRFMSPDPANYGAIDESPQTWNAYSYVANNPLNATDPDGLDCVYTQGFSKTGEVTVERGNCTQKGGTYVDGTIDTKSLTYNSKTNELGYSFSNAEQQTGGAGTISLGPPPNPNSNSGELNPFATGVFTQLNKMPIEKFVGVVYGGSVVLGLTGGAACYYLCAEAAATTLAGETGTELVESANTLNKIIGGPQRELLKEFFETGKAPEGLSQRTLQIYKQIAQRAISAGKDQLGVQAQRIQMISNALK
jgi:RHS repeat-associated protein